MSHMIPVYVGTYSRPIVFGTGETFYGKGKGIHPYLFDTEDGSLRESGPPAESYNPSFLCLASEGKLLYAVNERSDFQGTEGGSLEVYRVEADGRLSLLERIAAKGKDPCYVFVEKRGRLALTANYGGGSLSCFPLDSRGCPKGEVQCICHQGHGPNSLRQEAPHVHSVVLTGDGRYAVAADLGTDSLTAYPANLERGCLEEERGRLFRVGWGRGPRLFKFNKAQNRCYVVCELTCEVLVLEYGDGEFRLMQSCSTLERSRTSDVSEALCSPEAAQALPSSEALQPTAADIGLDFEERFLYVSTRGTDSLAVFSVESDGRLGLVEIVPAGVKTPRSFSLDPSGRWLLAGGQDSDTLAVHARDSRTGRLTLKAVYPVPTPVCICVGERGQR